MRRTAAWLLAVWLLATPLFAQTGGSVNVKATDTSTGRSTEVGDNTNHALRVSQAGSWLVSGIVAVSQSGTWTVQPGNTANTTAWLVTGLGGTFPATQSGTWNVGTVTTITNVVHVDDNSGSLTVDGTVTANLGTLNGAATAANQGTANTSLASIDGKITAVDTGNVTIAALPNEGQQTMVNSVSVAIASNQSAVPVSGPLTDTQLRATAVPVDGSGVTQPVSGTVAVSGLSGDVTVIQGTATNLKAQAEAYQGGSAVSGSNPLQVTLANTAANATAVKVDGSAVTQPVSGTVTVTDGSGALNVIVDSGSTVVTQGTATNLKTQAEAYQGGTAVSGSNPLQVTLANTGANATAVKVDGSAVTQPVSGTVTVTDGAGALNVIVDSGSTAVTQATASSLNAQVVGAVASAGSNAGNPVKVGGAFNTTQPTVTNTQIVDAQYTARGGAIVATGTDTFNVTVNAALPAGTAAIGKLAANSGVNIGSVDVLTVNGVAPAFNTGTRGTTVQRVTVATDDTVTVNQGTATNLKAQAEAYQGGTAVGSGNPLQVTLANTGANSTAVKVDGTGGTFAVTQATATSLKTEAEAYMGGTAVSSSAPLYVRTVDPCDGGAKVSAVFSISSATTTQLVAASASNKLYVCSINLVASAAENVALIEDDTSACASPTAGMAGGTTAATGWNLAANGGLVMGNGASSVAVTAATNRYVCLITSSTAQLSGNMMYVLAP